MARMMSEILDAEILKMEKFVSVADFDFTTRWEPKEIWPWLLKPVAKTPREWADALQFEVLIFGDYLTPLGEYSDNPICIHSQKECRRKVVENKNGMVVLRCPSSENKSIPCECDKQKQADYEMPYEELELFKLEINDILEKITEVAGIPKVDEFAIAVDNTLILEESYSSDGDLLHIYLVCSNELVKIHKAAKELIYYKNDDFAILVGHDSFIHDNTWELIDKQPKCVGFSGMNLLFHMEVTNPPTPEDLKTFDDIIEYYDQKWRFCRSYKQNVNALEDKVQTLRQQTKEYRDTTVKILRAANEELIADKKRRVKKYWKPSGEPNKAALVKDIKHGRCKTIRANEILEDVNLSDRSEQTLAKILSMNYDPDRRKFRTSKKELRSRKD